MSGKRRHTERMLKKQALLQKDKLDALTRGVAVDMEALAPHNSYSQPDFVNRGYYVDMPFACQACGVSQTWTAAQQKWWYEVAKGSVFSTAKLCRSCRQKGGDPHPYKSPSVLLTKIRGDIEPALLSAGFRLIGSHRRNARRAPFVDYGRSGDLLTLSWDQHKARLAAELLTDGGTNLRAIATLEFSGVKSTADIDDRLAPFLASVQHFLNGLRESRSEPDSRPESRS